MKVYVVTQAVSDDDGNFSSTVEGVYTDETKAISKVKDVHDEIINFFNEPDDDYEDGDRFFEICETDDIMIRRVVSIEAREVE